MRVVIDTNIIIATINKSSPYRWIFDGIINGKLILCVSTEIVLEYREILERKTNSEIADNFVAFLMASQHVENVDIYYNFNMIQIDSSDNKFSDCAIAANAAYLVTNDRHFQVLKTIDFPKVNLLSLQEFDSIKTNI